MQDEQDNILYLCVFLRWLSMIGIKLCCLKRQHNFIPIILKDFYSANKFHVFSHKKFFEQKKIVILMCFFVASGNDNLFSQF